MSRFVIEHLPRTPASYRVTPLAYGEGRTWLRDFSGVSLVRTTELIAAIESGIGVTLTQSDASMSLRPGDEALLISTSFGVLLACAQGGITPLPEDWRFSLLIVESDDQDPLASLEAVVPDESASLAASREELEST